jgi:hypothetical protein
MVRAIRPIAVAERKGQRWGVAPRDWALADLLSEAGLKVVAEGSTECDFHHPNISTCSQAGRRLAKSRSNK